MKSVIRFFNIIIFLLSWNNEYILFLIWFIVFSLFWFGIWSIHILVLRKEFNADVAQMFFLSLSLSRAFRGREKKRSVFFPFICFTSLITMYLLQLMLLYRSRIQRKSR